MPAAQLASQADAAPFDGPAAGAASEVPTCTGVTPAAVRSGRVCVRRGGWRAAVRSARRRAARLRRGVLGAPRELRVNTERRTRCARIKNALIGFTASFKIPLAAPQGE